MTCEECGEGAVGRAEGWEAFVVDMDDDGQDKVVFFCGVCASNEFHRFDADSLDERRNPE